MSSDSSFLSGTDSAKSSHRWLKRLGFIAAILAAAALIVLLIYLFFLRPWQMNWGATQTEVHATLPGDKLVPEPKLAYTRAITIAAPVDEVWQWVVQMGYKRAGFYNHDIIMRLMGQADYVDGWRSSRRIVPELQELKEGDTISIHSGAHFTVRSVEPQKMVLLLARVNVSTNAYFELTDPLPKEYLNNSWLITMEPLDPETTRLISRQRYDFRGSFGTMLYFIEPGAFLQESAMLQGIKQRSEKNYADFQ